MACSQPKNNRISLKEIRSNINKCNNCNEFFNLIKTELYIPVVAIY